MSELVLDADVLARAAFGTSRLAETVGALGLLRHTQPRLAHRQWRAEHLPAYRQRLADDPVAAAIAAHAFSPSWTADFLTVPPIRPGLTLDEELGDLESMSDAEVRADLERVRAPLAPELSASGLAASAAGLLRWVWATTVAPTWARRERVLAADVVARTSRLSRGGWSAVLDDLRPGMRWLGDGRLQVTAHPHPPRDARGANLVLLAAHCHGGWLAWRLREPVTFGVVYPVSGIFAGGTSSTPDALARLLGAARATVLVHAAEPVSTTALVALVQLPLSTVASHLRVLLDAGLLRRRRSGREVLYWWTEAGRELVAAATAAPQDTVPPERLELPTNRVETGRSIR